MSVVRVVCAKRGLAAADTRHLEVDLWPSRYIRFLPNHSDKGKTPDTAHVETPGDTWVPARDTGHLGSELTIRECRAERRRKKRGQAGTAGWHPTTLDSAQ